MGNYRTVKQELYHYILARTPLIVVDSPERERVERMLREISAERSVDILYYTDLQQARSIRGDAAAADVEGDPLNYIVTRFRKQRGVTFAFGDVRRISDDNSYSRELLNILYLARENNGTLILITADRIWQRLMQFGMIATLCYPDIGERTAQIGEFIRLYQGRFPVEWDGEDVTRAAALLRGFSEIQINNILSSAIIAGGGLDRSRIHELSGQKSRLYSSVSAVQHVHVDSRLQVSGLNNLKQWLSEKKGVFFASDDALASRGLKTPKGILLAGVPGCGKSFSARMAAREWELPLFRFDIGAVYDKWVGESEKRLKESLDFIENVAPCVLWIDEIEKALAVSDTSNDTGRRVLGQFLFWLQESNSRVFLIATANDIGLLPTELFRKGRFSEVFFIDLPNRSERRDAILQYTEQALHVRFTEDELSGLVEMTRGFSYSDIENAIKDVAQGAVIHGQQYVTYEAVQAMIRSVVPISQSNPEAIESIRKWGRERACPASLPAEGE